VMRAWGRSRLGGGTDEFACGCDLKRRGWGWGDGFGFGVGSGFSSLTGGGGGRQFLLSARIKCPGG
jgi:hypothetical protein